MKEEISHPHLLAALLPQIIHPDLPPLLTQSGVVGALHATPLQGKNVIPIILFLLCLFGTAATQKIPGSA